MAKDDKSIRQSQVITTFGVGGIYDVMGESFVLCDTTLWDRKDFRARGKKIAAPRLVADIRSRGLKVHSLHEPVEMEAARRSPFAPPTRGLPYSRFPRWLFCPACRRMTRWGYDLDRDRGDENPGPPTCPSCGPGKTLSPMRLIVICDDGHMGDVPWDRWVHRGQDREESKPCSGSESLYFRTRSGRGGGFDSLFVECRACGASKSLAGITSKGALGRVGITCDGKQPWQSGRSAEACDRQTSVVQRGAGNVHYPQVTSALTIPPHSDPGGGDDLRAQIEGSDNYRLIEQSEGNPDQLAAVTNYLVPIFALMFKRTEADVRTALADEPAPDSPSDGGIPSQEWEALSRAHRPTDPSAMFVNEALPLLSGESSAAGYALNSLVDRVMAVRKLREVRAFTGFYRDRPGGGDGDSGRLMRPDLGAGQGWVPAVEVFGEGIFVTFNEPAMQLWEANDAVVDRVAKMEAHRKNHHLSGLLPKATPRYVVIHTLAHLLIRRLAFSCGYSSSSLQERVYATTAGEGQARAGCLIYTAAGDSEGTLGGLVRQAEPPRFARNLIASLYDGASCSSDPVCRESTGQGTGAMNLASCHACSLLAETSCQSMNLLLDRVLVVGGDGVPGFFESVLNEALIEAV